MVERNDFFRSDKILDTIIESIRECVRLKGYRVSMDNVLHHLPLYSTKLLVFLDVMPNALHIDTNDATVLRILGSPGQYVDIALHYFGEVRSIPRSRETDICWIHIEFFARTVSFYMTILNTNVQERIDQDGNVIGYINLLDNHR